MKYAAPKTMLNIWSERTLFYSAQWSAIILFLAGKQHNHPRAAADRIATAVYRDFPLQEFASGMVLLSEYMPEKWQHNPARVTLATRKVPNGGRPALR
jgi:hypothetical protein